jgi:hypothetical protein
MKRHAALLLTLFVLFSASATFATAKVEKADCPIRFAVIGDRTGGAQPGIHEKIIAEVERLKPDFAITVGDAIEGYTRDTVTLNQQWKEYKEILGSLSMPVYFTPGNHDVGADSATASTMRPIYERLIGKPYYSFDVKGLHFIILDTGMPESSDKLPKEQLDWLASDLKKNIKAPYTFVFFHKPFWRESIAKGKPDTLHSLFRAYGVDAVFNGHHHQYSTGIYDGIRYTTVGSSGGIGDPGPTGLLYHFIWVTVDKKGIAIAPIKMGSVLPWDEVTTADLAMTDKIARIGIDFLKPLEINEDLSAGGGEVTVTATNPSSQALQDTLRWTLTPGWSIEPLKAAVNIPPGQSALVKFKVKNQKKLYPVPKVALRFPFGKEKAYERQDVLLVARKAYAYRAAKPPVLDGKLTDKVWQKPVTRFFAPDGGPGAIDSTFYYFAYDDKNLYLATRCVETKMDEMVAKVTARDGVVFGEDCAGFFFQPDTAKGIVYQIYINPLGAVFDQKITFNPDWEYNGDPSWNGTYEVKTEKGKKEWTLEAAIPLAQLGATGKAGEAWRLNFRRKQKRLNTSGDWQVPISYDPRSFGRLVLAK